jgi:hypothetical protein
MGFLLFVQLPSPIITALYLIAIARQYKKIQRLPFAPTSRNHHPGALGRVNPKVLPLPTWLLTHTVPWWDSTMFLTMLSPKPTPSNRSRSR